MTNPTTNTPAAAPPHRLKAITVLGTGMDARYARKGLHLVHSTASTPADSAGCAPGIGCMRQHDCADTHCPGRPTKQQQQQLRSHQTAEGLHRVDTDQALPGGIYRGPMLPDDDADYARFTRGALRAYAIGVLLGLVVLAVWKGF